MYSYECREAWAELFLRSRLIRFGSRDRHRPLRVSRLSQYRLVGAAPSSEPLRSTGFTAEVRSVRSATQQCSVTRPARKA